MDLLAKEISRLEQGATSLGLSLNVSKCEVITDQPLADFPTVLAGFKRVEADRVMLLGSPLSRRGALDDALDARVQCLKLASVRLRLLHSHDALLILKNSLSTPALLHVIRVPLVADIPLCKPLMTFCETVCLQCLTLT